jgi:hypothetical protein
MDLHASTRQRSNGRCADSAGRSGNEHKFGFVTQRGHSFKVSGVFVPVTVMLLLVLPQLTTALKASVGPGLAGFEPKTAKIRQKGRKKLDRPCVFGVPADTMMTPL